MITPTTQPWSTTGAPDTACFSRRRSAITAGMSAASRTTSRFMVSPTVPSNCSRVVCSSMVAVTVITSPMSGRTSPALSSSLLGPRATQEGHQAGERRDLQDHGRPAASGPRGRRPGWFPGPPRPAPEAAPGPFGPNPAWHGRLPGGWIASAPASRAMQQDRPGSPALLSLGQTTRAGKGQPDRPEWVQWVPCGSHGRACRP